MRYHLAPVEMAVIKKINVTENMGKGEHLYTGGGKINW